MRDFYTDYYKAMAHSEAHAEFCERVFGRNLCQHGFADMAQIDALIGASGLRPGQAALDLGCGNGMIAEYIADCSGAHVTGLDFIPEAIEQARARAAQRTAGKGCRLSFMVGDINALDLPPTAYDVIISIDSIIFSEDYAATVRKLKEALRPGGRLAVLYAHGREPWVPVEQFDAGTLAADKTPLAVALAANGLVFQTWDFTADDFRLAVKRKEVLLSLRERFEAEGITFIYNNRMGDAEGVRQAVEEGLQRRYLYVALAV